MATERIEVDHLIVGSGAMGMAFADVVLEEQPRAEIALVDRHARPGGHWNDAYPFVSLHQPAAFYGVTSESLGSGGAALASGVEVLAYYERVMRKFRSTGRVHFFPMSEFHPDGSLSSCVDPDRRVEVTVRKRLVDATYMDVRVPSIRPPAYEVAEGVPLVPLNDLPKIREPYRQYVIVGAGKTGMDAALFLLDQGVDPRQIRWIVPNDAWFLDRDQIQPGRTLDFFAAPLEHILASRSVDEVFHSLEADQRLLRLDREVWPTKYRCATVDRRELIALRRIEDVVRLGRVERIDHRAIQFTRGTLEAEAKALYVDCTADGLARRPVRPVFEANRLTLQSLVMCQQVFSASVIAHVAGMGLGDEESNRLCAPVPHPEVPRDFLSCSLGTFRNLEAWTPRMPIWLQRNRLNFAHHEPLLRVVRLQWRLRSLLPRVMERIEEILAAEPQAG